MGISDAGVHVSLAESNGDKTSPENFFAEQVGIPTALVFSPSGEKPGKKVIGGENEERRVSSAKTSTNSRRKHLLENGTWAKAVQIRT